MAAPATIRTEAAPSQVIEGKLHPPRSRPGVFPRARLLDVLDDAADSSLTLVAAPAGYGKTMLLTTWCATTTARVIWTAVDDEDSDPDRLWTHVAAAASRTSRGLGGDALQRLRAPGIGLASAIDSLLSAIAAEGQPFAIVLDDLDRADSEESLHSVEQAITLLPENARLVAATRSDPAIGLPRLRANNLLTEIRATELAFTREEAEELIVRTNGVGLSAESLDLLVGRTEGWPAGLYLAVLWLRDQDDPDQAAREFGANTRQVADYLTESIVASLDGDTKEFLRHTAVLDRLTPDLCDELLDRDDSRAILSQLAASNLFLVPLEGEGEWYRYHHLFRELLRLDAPATIDPSSLHTRAADWFQGRGLIEDAVRHAWAAKDLELVADLLVEHGVAMGRSGRVAFVRSWLERLPVELLLDRPLLPAVAALMAGVLGRPQVEVERMLELVDRSRRERPEAWRPEIEGYIAMARSFTVDNDDVASSFANARRAVEIARRSLPDDMVSALAILSRASFFVGDLASAKTAAHEAVTRPEAAERPNPYVVALGLLAMIESEQSRPEHASAWARQALVYARTHGLADAWFMCFAHLGLSTALLQMGRLGGAEREARRAEELRRGEQASITHAYALLRLADARIARGRLHQAEHALASANREIAEFRDPGRLTADATEVEHRLDAATRVPNDGPHESPSPGELAVLRYLPSELSQREIAARLYISLNTLRTHTRALYRKLGVHSREEAVARADALGLLDDGRPAPPDDS